MFQNFEVSKFQNLKLLNSIFSKCGNAHFQQFQVRGSHMSQNVVFEIVAFFFVFVAYLGAFKIKNNWFGESWSRAPGPRTIKMKGLGLSYSEVEK